MTCWLCFDSCVAGHAYVSDNEWIFQSWKIYDVNITFILNVTVHTRVPSNGILPMLRIPNRQNLLPELYRTEFSVQKIPTCEQLRQILSACAASFKWRETLYVVSGFKVNVFFTFLWQITFSFNFSLIFMWAFYKLFCFFFPIFINFGWYKIFNFLQFC